MDDTNISAPGTTDCIHTDPSMGSIDASIFRPEAVAARSAGWLGDVVIIKPIAFHILCLLAAGASLAIVLFFAIATYTRRTSVTGQLVPQQGMIKVFAPQAGVVVEKRVSQGQVVRKGEVLYVVSSDRESEQQELAQAVISRLVTEKKLSLEREVHQTRALQQIERESITRKIATLAAEVASLDSIIAQELQHVEVARDEEKRYRELASRDLVSMDELQQKQADLADQMSRVGASQRDRISATRDLALARDDLRSLGLKDANGIEQIQRELDSAGQELSESEVKRRVTIAAPEDGVAAIVVAEVGQVVDTAKPLAGVVPKGMQLQAHLYAPSKATGFARSGDTVLLRYDAYPYQKFGSFSGVITEISRTPLSSTDLTGFTSFSQKTDEPLYRITVHLNSQSIRVRDRIQPLQAGMLVDADLLQETRRLYEWVLEPLYALSATVDSPAAGAHQGDSTSDRGRAGRME
jgi:membrane fusion protein